MNAFSRRLFLKVSSLSSLAWMSSLGLSLAAQRHRRPAGGHRATSLIVLWLDGGPSQLETFDPHPGTRIGGPTRAIDTCVPGVQIAQGLERLAEQMDSVSLIRSITTEEGDHERANYLMRTGYRPSPTVVHPAIGAILATELPDRGLRIPRHIAILPGQWAGRGGLLGDQHDAFRVGDPLEPIPDLAPRVEQQRLRERLDDLSVVEDAFARRRRRQTRASAPSNEGDAAGPDLVTRHRRTVEQSLAMMAADELRAFRVEEEPERLRQSYGDTPFGRGCLAARRLVEAGVPCVEVTLGGWDTHIANFETTTELKRTLDPAFAALIADLKQRALLDSTLVLCMGEFGRTPMINPTDGRDHWPHAFSVAAAGGGLRGGVVVGETDAAGTAEPRDPITADDLFATVLTAMGIDPRRQNFTDLGRPIRLSEGTPVEVLLAGGDELP